jgi:hypothetical protein
VLEVYTRYDTCNNELPIATFGERIFAHRQQNKEWHKKFFKKFMALKGHFKALKASINLKTFDSASMDFNRQWRFDSKSTLKLVILDIRDVPSHLNKRDIVESPYFLLFIEKLALQKKPTMHDPPAWLWISRIVEKNAQVVLYVEKYMKDYLLVMSMYYCVPNKHMYRIKKHIVHGVEVYLKFFFKIGLDHLKVDVYYYLPFTECYKKMNYYKELQFQVSNMVLRMKFYLDLIEKFCSPRKSVYCTFARSKTMHAVKVSF